MKVKDIFTIQKPCACLNTDSWQKAAQLLLQEHLSAVPVVNENGKLIGILSEKDLFRALFPLYKNLMETPDAFLDFETMEQETIQATNRTVEEVMSKRILTASPDTHILKIGALMSASGIHQVPVIENGKLIGMIGRCSIYRAILSKYFQMVE